MTNDEIAAFFAQQKVHIVGNIVLREPQRDGYFLASSDHFSTSREPGYVQLPVGCGKTGLMGLAPFGVAQGHVLISGTRMSPSEATVLRELEHLWTRTASTRKEAFSLPERGPFMSELKNGSQHP